MPIAQLITGIAAASALIRWGATLRASGWQALSRAVPTARLRWTQYSSRRRDLWTLPAALAVLLLLIQFAVQLAVDGWTGVFKVGLWLVAALFAMLATFSCPPTILYLGSSEPGSYRFFRYLSDRYSWITVSALKESDVRATDFNDYRRSITSRLVARRLRTWLNGLAPLRLESLRASDEVWEDVVGRALRICNTVLLDLRSGGLFVRGEFLQVLRSAAVDRTVVIVRDDGTSCIDNLVSDRVELMNAFRSKIGSKDLRHALHAGWTPFEQKAGPSIGAATSAELAGALATLLERRGEVLRDLLRRIIAASGPDTDLDCAIFKALESGAATSESCPALTSSSGEAGAFTRRVAPDAQYSLHLTDERGRMGAGVGRENILSSFRTVTSARVDHVTCGLALMDALVQSELGHGIGTAGLTHVLVRIVFSTGSEVALDDAIVLKALLERVRADGPDPNLDADLVNSLPGRPDRNYHIQPSTNLDDALRLVQCWSAEWRAAVYVDATVGTAFAEVYTRYGAGYRVAVSLDEDGTAQELSPPRAVLSGWLKGRLGQWDFYGQAGGSMAWCLGTPGERTLLSDGDRQTLGTNARQIGLLR